MLQVRLSKHLKKSGFTKLDEDKPWKLTKGKSYFTQRNGSVLCFKTPEAKPKTCTIVGSHTDSPALKIKPEVKKPDKNLLMLGVEVYGSPILSSWIGRDLEIAGKVITKDKEYLVRSKSTCIIPHLAIHLDRETNDKKAKIDKQLHLCPLVGLGKDDHLIEKITGKKDILSYDLFLVPKEEARVIGIKR